MSRTAEPPAPVGVYIHLPFCLTKCGYCNFYSLPVTDDKALSHYTDKLCLLLSRPSLSAGPADTVYFGGGTPSLLGAARTARILGAVDKAFGLTPNAEITLEANPTGLNSQQLRDLRAAGINRLSIGLQATDDRLLALLGRRHTAQEAFGVVAMARQAGFSNISLDIMLGIPGQTMEALRETLSFCIQSGAVHLSVYMLKLEEGTPLSANEAALAAIPGEDETADLYLGAAETLAQAGYMQYEISNFAVEGYESRHNLKYWEGGSYLGLGPSAHSCLNGRRFYFPPNLHRFLEASDPWKLLQEEEPSTLTPFEEYAMLRLRLAKGLDLAEAKRRYGTDTAAIRRRGGRLAAAGVAVFRENRIALTPRGFLLSNPATAALLWD